MAIELVVPNAGESITKVQIGAWLRQEGDAVEKDEIVVEIETDKATMEVSAPVAGVLAKVLKREGEPAAVGEVVALLEPAKEGAGRIAPMMSVTPARAATTDGAALNAAATTTVAATAGVAATQVMPAAQRVLAEHGLSAADVPATGPGGRLLKEDVLRHVAAAKQGGTAAQTPERAQPAPSAAPAETGGAAFAPAETDARSPESAAPAAVRSTPPPATVADAERAPVPSTAREEDAVPMSPMRQKIAQRLVEAQRTAAILTTFNEVDMSAVLALRQQYQDAFQQKYQIKLGFMSFFVKAAIDALKLIPQVNAEIRSRPGPDGQPLPHIVYRNYYDIGVAVSGQKGLVVPVIRDAERLSFAELEQVIADFGARARDSRIKLEELAGGTFTISNGGTFGSLLSTPILNPPQSGILGLHAMQDRPVARDGQVVIRPMMYVALSYDHRIIDGREAVTFLRRIKDCVENPARMLIEV